MKKKLIISASLLALSVTTQAGEWEFLPVMGNDYQANFAIAAIAGTTKANGESASTTGVEVSLNCPLLKVPNHTIRQQITYARTDKDGVETESFELSPHHMFDINSKLSAGLGPSLGFTKVDTSAGDDTVFTYGLGVSTRYNINKSLFVSAEVRYVKSEDIEIAGATDDFDNTRALLKVGYQF